MILLGSNIHNVKQQYRIMYNVWLFSATWVKKSSKEKFCLGILHILDEN